MIRKTVLATAVVGALGGLFGCSEGDEAVINIDAPTNNTTNNTTGGSDGGDTGGGTGGVSQNCPDWAGAKPRDADGNDVCALPAQIGQSRTLDNDIVWLMEGRVTVGNGNTEIGPDGELTNGNALQDVTLTIQEGTEIKGVTGTFANLLITRGSKIQAVGTADAPIIFSSDDPDYEGAGEWGGLIIHGFGLHNQCTGLDTCNIDSEGESGFAGGFDPEDSSGRLSYVIVTEGGFEFSVGNEINGISLMSAGRGTQLDHLQIHDNSDDGIEYYGGEVDTKYLVVTGSLDDSVDWDEGFVGNMQYVIVKQNASAGGGNWAFEMDTQGAPEPLSKPTVANFTIIGNSNNSGGVEHMLEFKAGSGGFFHNGVFSVADENTTIQSCLRVTGADAQALINTALVLNNIVADCAGGDDLGTVGNDTLDATTIFPAAAQLDGNLASQAPEAQLSAPISWTEINGIYSESLADGDFLDETDFIGAVNPDGSDVWWQGWTLPGTLD